MTRTFCGRQYRPGIFSGKERFSHEKDISAQQSEKKENPWFSPPDEYGRRQNGSEATAPERQKKAVRLGLDG